MKLDPTTSPEGPSERGPLRALPAKRQPWAWAAFSFVAVTSICNDNGLIVMRYGFARAASIPILVACLIVLATCDPRTRGRAANLTARLFLAFLGSYLLIGLLFAMGQPQLSVLYYVMSLSISGLVFAVGAIGGWLAWGRYANRSPVLRAFGLFLLPALSIYLSTAWNGLYESVDFTKDQSRYSGVFANPNLAGLAACTAVALGLASLTNPRNSRTMRAGILASVLVAGVAVTLTFSRSALACLLLLILAQPFLSRRGGRITTLLFQALLIGAVAWGLFVVLSPDSGIRGQLTRSQTKRVEGAMRMVSEGSFENEQREGKRIHLAKLGLSMIADAPWGNGLGACHRMPGVDLGPHNTFILIAGEGGPIPFFLFMAFFWRLFREIRETRELELRLAGLNYLVVLGIAMMASHSILHRRYHMLLLGALVGCVAAARQAQRAEHRRLKPPSPATSRPAPPPR